MGALARYGISGWIHGWSGSGFPWGTLLVNLSGSLLLGFCIRLLDGLAVSPDVRGMITIGFFGAYTTFSTFAYESVGLLQAGEWERAGVYLFGSVAFGLLGMWMGLRFGTLALQGGS